MTSPGTSSWFTVVETPTEVVLAPLLKEGLALPKARDSWVWVDGGRTATRNGG